MGSISTLFPLSSELEKGLYWGPHKTDPENNCLESRKRYACILILLFLLQAVITCIKNKEYEHANKILKKYLSQDPSSKVNILDMSQ